MKQRIAALGVVGAAAVLGLLLLWGGLATRPVSAMEKMAENVRKAKSYQCTEIIRTTDDSRKSGEPAVSESIYTVYWLAPGSARTESTHSNSGWKGPGPEITDIHPAGKPGIRINHQTKTYRRHPALLRTPYSGISDDLENLGRFSGEADHELGTKEINGKKARGFQIERKKMGGGLSGLPGLAEIWLDPGSNLPVLVRYTGMKTLLATSSEQENSDIQWNIELDPNLFDTTPPEGYTDDTPRLTLDEQVCQMTEALKIWAETSQGHYPRSGGGAGIFREFSEMFGVAGWRTNGVTKEKREKARKALKGIDQITDVRAYNPDFAYYGKTVGPKDKDKVLLRWKLDDGRYEVIFGDLRVETVTAEQLRALEAK